MEISCTELDSWADLAAETTGAYATRGKWMRGYGTRLVWNSFRSTLREPSKRSEAVMEETTRAVRQHNRSGVVIAQKQLTLSNQAVQVLVVGTLNAKVATADVVDGFVVDHEGAVGVLKSGVGSQDRVVWLDDGSGDLRSWVDTELELALLAVVDGETLHKKSTETGTSTTTEGVEDEEALETRAVICNSSDLVEDLVDQLLANSVVSTSVVVGSILLAGDHLLRVEQAAVCASADFVDNVGLQISVDGTGNVLAVALVVLALDFDERRDCVL